MSNEKSPYLLSERGKNKSFSIIENKYKSRIFKYIAIKKLYLKLREIKEKVDQKTKGEHKSDSEYYNVMSKYEIQLFNFILPSLESNRNTKNNDLIKRKNRMKNIINIILNRNDNKNKLDKRYIKWFENYELIDKENQSRNDNKSFISNKNKKGNGILNDDKIIYKKKTCMSYHIH